MNCEKVHDKLIDLVYDELSGADAAAVTDHLDRCPDCRTELDLLRRGRTAMAAYRASEPSSAVTALDQLPTDAPRRRLIRWPFAAAGLAAAALALIAMWLVQVVTPPALAGEIEIKRLNVSLTILSEPADWPKYASYGGAQQIRLPIAQTERAVQRPYQAPLRVGWQGLALVRDERMVRHLPRGRSKVTFTHVPSRILPDTVRLQTLAAKGDLTILEQNYQYDLASTWAVLHKHLDKPVTAIFKGGPSIASCISPVALSLKMRLLLLAMTTVPSKNSVPPCVIPSVGVLVCPLSPP